MGGYVSVWVNERLIAILFNVMWRAGKGKERERRKAKCVHAPVCVESAAHCRVRLKPPANMQRNPKNTHMEKHRSLNLQAV